MLKISFMDEEITVEKPENYSELLDIIKNEFLLGDDELEGTIFIFEDQINGGKSKLIPQVFNQFINQENPILFIEVQENSKIYQEALDMSDDLEDINKISNKDNRSICSSITSEEFFRLGSLKTFFS